MSRIASLVCSLLLLVCTALCDCQCDSVETQVFAPLPTTATGLTLGPGGYAVESFGQGAYMVTEGGYQSLFLVSDKGVILVDAPPTIGRKIQYAIGNITDQPVTHFVYSHHHADHAGGAYLFAKKGVKFIAHVDAYYSLSQVSDKNRPTPDIKFHDDYTLKVGNQTLELSYKGPNHEPGNIFIYAKKQQVLMLVDVVYPGWIPFTELGVSTFIPGWIKAHDQILEYPFKHYLGGHLGRSGSREDVEIQREYVTDLFNNCKKTVELSATNDTNVGTSILGPTSQLNPGNSWAQFKVYLDVTAQYCANLTNAKWVGRLGAADVFDSDNAFKMIESLRIDYDVLGPFAVQ